MRGSKFRSVGLWKKGAPTRGTASLGCCRLEIRLCASVGTVTHPAQPDAVFPQELAPGVFRCGYNARDSFGAHSYFVQRDTGNLMIDAPRFVNKLVRALERPPWG